MATLPPFPTHDTALDVLEHALSGSLVDSEHGPVLVGAEFSFQRVLEFYSGRDENLSLPDGRTRTYAGMLYSERDVIAALTAEVRMLRTLIREGRTE